MLCSTQYFDWSRRLSSRLSNFIIARAGCFCKMSVKSRFQLARPRTNHLMKLSIWARFFEVEKTYIFGPNYKQYL